ncbi:hypothetical protein RHMOL_Rhmol11G0210500 [Rhododendron molle]|uniref:Uncharacterized protein n=1 Tax=Rhododendron molle TaxID=49168 RepID=A0ACC0LW81_RHOML|nr:hypothetical protein RHMOL_Rhmol11G0210500 [Rhododendron molle]
MATSELQNPSSSSSNPGGRYDIFLSFRGLDTRKKFTDHLYHALMREGFQTFRDDDEIERGEDIKSELLEAIRNSRMSVTVLSENYANSTACLFELQTILELCKKSGHFVLPVFYEVEPWVLKEQAKNLNFGKKEVAVEKVKGWSAALREVASMAGMVFRKESDGHEPTPHPSQGSGHEEGAGLEGEPEGEVASEKGKERVPFELGRLVDSDSDDSVEEISQMPSPGHAIEAIQHMVVLENHVVCSVKMLEERAKELAEAKDEAELLRTEADQLKTERGAMERELVAREADLFSARQRVSELEELLRKEKEGRSEEVQRSYEEGAKYAKNELQAQVPEIQEKAYTKGWKSCLATLKVPPTSSVWTEIPSMKRRASSSSSTHVPLAKSDTSRSSRPETKLNTFP